MRTPTLERCIKLLIVLTAITILASIPASAAPQGAAFTTFDPSNPDPNLGGCLDGQHPNGIDCNNYFAKPDVYINGGPTSGNLSDGCYYFAVLVPGFQNGGFVDGANGNLSDTTKGSTAGDLGTGDAYTNRIFHVKNHAIDDTYSVACGAGGGTPHALGTDNQGHTIIQLMPYDDTSNMGGVYIAAICQVNPGPAPAASPDQCKYDAFRIKKSTPNGQPGTGTATVCKFWDQNFDHIWDNDEPFIGAWPISAKVSGDDNVTLDAASKDTDNTVVGGVPGPAFGCATFTLTWPTGDTTPVTVTFTEGSAPDSGAIPPSQSCNLGAQTCSATPAVAVWTQSAPWDFTNKVLVTDQVTASPSQDVTADNFGNFFGQDLTVSKTATPSFTRTYNWNIVKSLVSPTGNPVEESGSSVTITYSVEVNETGFTDSLWAVNGSITVTNPNAFDVTMVKVTDAVDDGGSCSVTDINGGLNETVPAKGTLVVPYSCSYTAQPAYTLATNTATAAWSAATFGTPDGSASGQATFTFNDGTTGNPTKVNSTVTVTDTFNGGSPVTLGTLTATDTTPYTDHTYTVTEKVTVPPGTCSNFTNSATVTGDNFSITTPPVNVTICNEQTGALTMGFWKNTNGQKIITNYCGGTSGTTLHAYLTSYNPFLDDTATNCSGEASYVAKVIGAATCGGSTCNPMLKAQMLATALDVYFSTPSLGGNRVGAYNGLGGSTPPLGGVGIDLSNICAMIDGSSGSTCSGTHYDVRADFGISTSCKGATVSTMLAYSDFLSNVNGSPNGSAVSNSGGSKWYAQNKTKQVGAKDGFDNVNNQIAGITTSVCSSTF